MIYAACLPDELQILNGGLHCDNWHFQPVVQSGFDNFVIDSQELKAGLSATLSIFAIGFVVGVVISLLKKAR